MAVQNVAVELIRQEFEGQRQEGQPSEVVKLLESRVHFAKKLKLFAHNAPAAQRLGLRSLSPFYIDRLIQVEGLLTSASDTIPEATQVTYRCQHCGSIQTQTLNKQTVAVPWQCSCGCKDLVLDYALGQFESKSRLRLQESPDATAPGETPVNVACVSLRAQI